MRVPDDTFVSLADLLRPQRADDAPDDFTNDAPAPCEAAVREPSHDACAGVASDVRLFGAQLRDAFDAARAALVRELAYAVLGRELLLAAPDIDAIAARILAEHPLAQPLRIRIAPDDVFAVDATAGGRPAVVCDPALAPGDAIVELTTGTIDARLGVRLAVVLEHCA